MLQSKLRIKINLKNSQSHWPTGCIFSGANRLKGTRMYKEWGLESFLKPKEVGKVAVIYSNDSTLINP